MKSKELGISRRALVAAGVAGVAAPAAVMGAPPRKPTADTSIDMREFDAFRNKAPERTAQRNQILRNDHFQVAYVTNDLARACRTLSDRYGIKGFRDDGGQLPAGGQMNLALAWAGGIMFELIEASGPGAALYNERLPAEGFAIRHHHLGYLVRNEEAWNALEQEIDRDGWTVALKDSAVGFYRAIYVDAPELGHYLEYILPEPGGIAFFESVPVS
jgi:hypothetical protein